MKVLAAILLGMAATACLAQQQEIQRALIQRDQMTAEFAAGVRGGDVRQLQNLHASQLLEVVTLPLQPELRPYQRQKMANERELVLPPPKALLEESKPLPLPGRPADVLDPIPAQGLLH